MPGTDSQLTRQGRRGRGDGITLSDIIRGLQYCVNSSQDIVEQHHIGAIGRFLDGEDRPVTRTIKFGNAAIDVPLLCLSGHTSLVLDELNVKLNLMLRNTALKSMTADPDAGGGQAPDQGTAHTVKDGRNARGRRHRGAAEPTRTSFGVDLANVSGPDRRYANLEIGMKFKSSAPPEMLSRIIDRLNNATDVYQAEDAKPGK
ncbi:MAG: DUF2589 domain-containing protein [Chitinispirillia bacterium]|nr:DUF2589 domain-containing protein [Chitinispirillia bacterium]